MIDITSCDLRKFVAKVYDLSMPVGMGFLHYQPGQLTDAEIDALIEAGEYAVHMDYVNGRQCKMNVWRDEEGRLTINDHWYDHTDSQLDELLAHVGVQREKATS